MTSVPAAGLPEWPYSPAARVEEVGERALIRWIAATLGVQTSADLVVGIGDDGAVVRARRNHVDVLTTDMLVEDVHFTRALSTPEDVGHRALHVNLSDVAAMGAEPRFALLSLGLPPSLEAAWVTRMVGALLASARASGVFLIGGNISRAPIIFVDVTVSGAAKPRHVLRRSGARPGDELYVSGAVGAAAAGLAWLQSQSRATRDTSGGDAAPAHGVLAEHDDVMAAVTRYRRPDARVALGVQVGRNKAASACMDTSDGLADALRQLAAASGIGVRVETAAVPVAPAVAQVAGMTGSDLSALIWSGGEDYELLFAVPRRARRRFLHATGRAGLPMVTRIGVCTRELDVLMVDQAGAGSALPDGFAHFAPSAPSGAD
ncbi:MAG: thiamine-phosphate kinase [Acidobacteria bacterium]|nr:thiamine-phosphate kinase [Acidobacteriota bacterium]